MRRGPALARHLEDAHHQAVMDHARVTRIPYGLGAGLMLADVLIHIPMGGVRRKVEAARLKAMGTKKGVSDFCLPLIRGDHVGLWLELKRAYHEFRSPKEAERALSDDQRSWLCLMNLMGHRAAVAYGYDAAWGAIEDYLRLPGPETMTRLDVRHHLRLGEASVLVYGWPADAEYGDG